MKRFALLITFIMCVVLTGCQSAVVSEKTKVSATITEMQYEDSYITFIPMFNAATKTTTLRPQTHSAQYLVTVTYEGISETFDNQTLYEAVKEGDTIQMILCKNYDKDGDLINQTLQLPEEP